MSSKSVGAAKSISISISGAEAELLAEIVPLIALNMRQVAASFPQAQSQVTLLLALLGSLPSGPSAASSRATPRSAG